MDQPVEERPLLALVHQREQLLELIHHEQQVSPGGHDAADDLIDPLRAVGQLGGESFAAGHRDPPQ